MSLIARDIVLVAIVATALVLSACTKEASNGTPPRDDSLFKTAEVSSTLSVPISTSLADLQQTLNAKIPNPLVAVDQELEACIPAKYAIVCPIPKISCHWFKCRKDGCATKEIKTKITPDISCRIVGRVDRGSILLTGAGKILAMIMPVDIDVSAKDVGGIVKSVTARGSADVRANASIDFDKNWQPTASLNADYSWNNRIGVDILGQRVTFASKVDPKIKDALEGFKQSIPARLQALKLKEKAADAWRAGFTTLQVHANPSIWLRFTPEKVGYSGYDISTGMMKLTLMVQGKTETFVGPKPPASVPTPLPELTKDVPDAGFDFYLPVVADYNAIADVARKALKAGQPQTFQIPGLGAVEATFEKVQVYQTADNAIAVGITLTENSVSRYSGTRGTVWMTAKPVLDNAKKTVGVQDLEVYGHTNNPAFDILLSVVRFAPVNDALKRALVYDFKEKYTQAVAQASKALSREIVDDVYMDGRVVDASVDDVVASPQGLFLGLEVRGVIALRYTHEVGK